MSVTLLVEDGNLVPNANTYVDVPTARTFAGCRDLSLIDDDAVLAQHLIRAMDYLEARRCEYQGCKVESTQQLQFPRQNWQYDGSAITKPDDGDPWFMPRELVAAQVQLAHEIHVGTPLYPPTVVSYTDARGAITEETIGPLTTEYSDRLVDAPQANVEGRPVIIATVETLLKPLLKTVHGFETIRV